MKNLNRCTMLAANVALSATLALVGCASSGTTSQPIPTANGTYDRALDPTASNGPGGTTAMHPPTPPVPAPDVPPTSVTVVTAAPVPMPTPVETPLTDGQIAQVISDVDTSEIDAGKLAATRATSPKVRAFGKQMQTMHGAVEKQMMTLEKTANITPSDSGVSSKLKDDSSNTKQALMAQTGNDFDRAYITAQLKGHQDVLALLDTKLIPAAQDARLRTQLEGIRAKVVAHIQMAEDAKAALPAQ